MSLPEKYEYLYEAEGTFAIAARDKDWANNILTRNYIKKGIPGRWIYFTNADYENLKKLGGDKMSLPEKKWQHGEHECRYGCPACIEDGAYKRFAQWILETFDFIYDAASKDYKSNNNISKTDYEALKKLAGKE